MEPELKADLSNYEDTVKKFKNPSVTVDAVVSMFDENKFKVLLIKRKNPPFADCWALPGGFFELGHTDADGTIIEPDKTLYDAVRRELKEETGIEQISLKQLNTYGDINRDPRKRVVSVAFFGGISHNYIERLTRLNKLKAMDDAKEFMWADIYHLPKLAFDHKKILSDFINRIKDEITINNFAFSFLPKKFTWSELQDIYEVMFNKKFRAPNFRRKMCNLYKIQTLDEYKLEKIQSRGRPSKYLKFIGLNTF